MADLPSLFISHGAPTFALEPGRSGPQLTALGLALPRPRAVLVVSPHWTTPQVRVATTPRPDTIHDFGGFPRALYGLRYPAPGEPALAARAAARLTEAGWPVEADPQWGLDHGAWVPLTYLYPDADVPVFQVSMPRGLDPAGAYRFGQALAPLSREGVLIVGSGSLTHNLYEFRHDHGDGVAAYAQEFVAWVRAVVQSGDHARLQQTLALAPHAQRAHPTTEHLLPLLVAAGAGRAAPLSEVRPETQPRTESPTQPANVTVLDGGFTHGVLSMESYVFGDVAVQSPATASSTQELQHA